MATVPISRQQRRYTERTERKLRERHSLRPGRLGTLRRKPKGPQCAQAPARQRGSLDNSNLLEISCADWLKLTETKRDAWESRRWKQAVLVGSIEKILLRLHDRTSDMLRFLSLPEHVPFLVRHPKLNLRLRKALARDKARLSRRQKDYRRLHNCQMEFIGYKATCCRTAFAVPVGCNHRLCFLCNAARAEKARKKIRKMFDRLEHPVFLTLTIPNLPRISKRSYSHFRAKFNKFRKAHAGWIKGGMIALETTYNSQPDSPAFGTWHLHAHVLIDSATALPVCEGCSVSWRFNSRRGKPERHITHSRECPFIAFKRRLEFDWLVFTQGSRDIRWRPSDFDYWFNNTWEESWAGDHAGREEWNLENRRTLDVRRVKNRQKAAYEVLKYITKASHFANIPEAVDEFITATRGTRMMQTFGTWYGFDFEDGEDVNSWAHLECECGKNEFEQMPGRLFLSDVWMDDTGRWRLQVFGRGSPPGQVVSIDCKSKQGEKKHDAS